MFPSLFQCHTCMYLINLLVHNLRDAPSLVRPLKCALQLEKSVIIQVIYCLFVSNRLSIAISSETCYLQKGLGPKTFHPSPVLSLFQQTPFKVEIVFDLLTFAEQCTLEHLILHPSCYISKPYTGYLIHLVLSNWELLQQGLS